jgi:hypothetical protein
VRVSKRERERERERRPQHHLAFSSRNAATHASGAFQLIATSFVEYDSM